MQKHNEDIFGGVSDLSDEALNELRKITRPDGVITPEILRRLRDGDHESYKKVYEYTHKPIRRFIFNLVGSDVDADDITQDVFSGLWTHRDRIDPEKNIRTLLFFVARRVSNKYRRSKKVRERYAQSVWFEESDFITCYDLVVEKEVEMLIRALLRRMPDMQRKIFEMSHDEGLSPEEIAARLNIKRETVYSNLSRARKEIRGKVLPFLILFAADLSNDSIREILRPLIQ